MYANKRSNVRKALYISVDVYNLGEHLGRYRSRNINIDGAFIDSCPCQLCPDDTLDLHFYFNESEQASLHLKATVIHSADMGVGVLFDYGDLEYRRLLNAIARYTSDGQAREIPGFWYVC
ncbi:MAG: PilZ domain-containing protein [Gammaproteobacteria bacterium]